MEKKRFDFYLENPFLRDFGLMQNEDRTYGLEGLSTHKGLVLIY